MEFVATVRRPYPPFYTSIMAEGEADSKEWKKFIFEEYSVDHLMLIEGVWHYPAYHMIDFPKRIVEKIFQDEKLFLHMKKNSLEREKKFKGSIKGNYVDYCKEYHRYMVTLATYFVCDDVIENKMKELLREKIGDEKTRKLMYYLTLPIEDNYNTKEKLHLVEERNLEENVEKFGWLHTRYGFIKEYLLEEAEIYLEKLEQENFLEKYKEQKDKISEAIEIAKNALGDKRHRVDVMQFFIFYRTQRTDVMNMLMYKYSYELEKAAKEKGLNYEELLFCTKKEFDENIPEKKELKKRKKSFLFVRDEKGEKILVGEEERKFKQNFLQDHNKQEYVTGRVAYPGTVVGRAKIIINLEDVKKVEKGDILVTNMTTPNMITAMHKAAGFVTDEGGITCHACIIAREMKKPCIIATKDATRTFKDGDLIKVDTLSSKVMLIGEKE